MDLRIAAIHIKLMWVALGGLTIFCAYHVSLLTQ